MTILKWAETFVQNCIELYYTLCLPSELANIKDYLKIVFSWHLDLSVAFPALCLLGKVLIMDTHQDIQHVVGLIWLGVTIPPSRFINI
jgi:hypothetical protein